MASAQRYIKGLESGDDRLIRELYAAFSPAVKRWVLNNSGNLADAQDLFQDALMAIYDRYCQGGAAFEGDFGALLMTICKRKWYNRLSQLKREESAKEAVAQDAFAPEAEAEAALAQQRRREGLSAVFHFLSEQCREVLTLLMAGKQSAEQIAEQTGLPNANAVYQSKHRCMARWRQLYHEHHQ